MMPLPSPQIDESTFERFRTLILQRSGLHFPPNRRADLERRLDQAFSRSDCETLTAYYRRLLQTPTQEPEWERLIGHLTVGETYFFRDHAQFNALYRHVLPELIDRKRSLTRQLRIWSAGCATGEEPYSIAMLLRHLLPDLSDWHITILATDINQDLLTQAQEGRYGKWSFREKKWLWMRERNFVRQGEVWELNPQIRRMVTFAYLNLAEDVYPSLINNTIAFDLILCRNVTIYFTPEVTQQVVGRVYDALTEGGWLVAGHSEPSPTLFGQFETHTFPGAVLHRKGSASSSAQPLWAEGAPAPSSIPLPQGEGGALPGRGEGEAPPPRREPTPQEIPPADLCIKATTCLEQGKRGKARRYLEQALNADPDNAQAHYLMGKIHADAGDWERGHHWCQQAIERDPLLAEAHFLLALIHSQEGNTDQALTGMKRVVYLERDAILGHFWLGTLYRELKDLNRSRKSLENARQLLEGLSPQTPIPWSDGMTALRMLQTVERQLDELTRQG